MRLLQALLAATLPAAAGAGGRVQLLPAGEFAARDGRPGPGKKWKLSDAAGIALAASLNATAAQTPLVIDYDHRTLYVAEHGGEAPAAGWMRGGFEWLAGQGLFAPVEWTARAKASIEAGEYRFVSPVVQFDDDTGEIKGVAMAALVNYPAILGMQPALAALAAQFPHQEHTMNPILQALLTGLGLSESATLEQATAALSAVQAAAKQKPPVLSAALAGALGVKPEADEAAALAAINTIKTTSAAGGDAATVQAMAALQGEIATLRAQVQGDKVTAMVDDAIKAGKLIPAQRDWALNYGKSSLEALSGFLATAVPMAGLQGQSGEHKPGGAGGVAIEALGAQVAAVFGLTAEQFAKGKPAAAAS
jgi:phage I-like protein